MTQAAIAPYFVRTPKSGLNLPGTQFDVVRHPMGPIQKAIYDGLKGRYRGAFKLETQGRRDLDRLGRIVMYLLEAASNPMLLTAGSDEGDDLGFAHPPIEVSGDERLTELLTRYREYETPWKYEKICEIVGAAQKGEKVLIWSSFVRNLKTLHHMLAPYAPAMIHGGVPPEDGAAPE